MSRAQSLTHQSLLGQCKRNKSATWPATPTHTPDCNRSADAQGRRHCQGIKTASKVAPDTVTNISNGTRMLMSGSGISNGSLVARQVAQCVTVGTRESLLQLKYRIETRDVMNTPDEEINMTCAETLKLNDA